MVFMMTRLSSTTLLATLAVAAAANASATPDRIYKSDGSIVDSVDVISEALDRVTYKPEKGRGEEEVESELVLRVEFTEQPEDVAAAEVDATNGALLGAISGFQTYLGGLGERGDRKHPWAAAYSQYRLIELFEQLNTEESIQSMVAAVDELVATYPDSRYVPLAFIKKIEAQLIHGDRAGAKASAAAFGALVLERDLAQRWKLEQQLRAVLSDEALSGTGLESALERISSQAAVFPTVSNRADVAIAESMLGRGAFDEAEAAFEGVTESPNADDRTLAAAWCGLGDCLYRRAEAMGAAGNAEGASPLFQRAQLAFMRVVVLYPAELAYVPKSAFYAGRCIQELGGELAKDQSDRLFNFVTRNFRGSRWADSARQFRRRN